LFDGLPTPSLATLLRSVDREFWSGRAVRGVQPGSAFKPHRGASRANGGTGRRANHSRTARQADDRARADDGANDCASRGQTDHGADGRARGGG